MMEMHGCVNMTRDSTGEVAGAHGSVSLADEEAR